MAEKQERRSIADAMNVTPEALAFIKGAPEKTIEIRPTVSRPAAAVEAAERPSEPDEGVHAFNAGAKPAPEQPRRRTYRSNESPTGGSDSDNLGFGLKNLLVPLTTRLQPSTAGALKRAGLEQKLRGHSPATVQEIVEVAITSWLKAAGYLR